MQNDPKQYRAWIQQEADAAGVPAALALAVATRESGIRQYDQAGNVKRGAAGELGIMQVKPSTAPGVDLTDPYANIKAGINYLKDAYFWLKSWPLAAAGYNAGINRVRDWLRGHESAPTKALEYAKAVTGETATTGGYYARMAPPGTKPGGMTQGQGIGLALVAVGIVFLLTR